MNKMKIYPEDTSAFPVVGLSQIGNQGIMEVYQIGMTLRDYFAAKVLSAIASDSMLNECMDEGEIDMILTNTASLSYRLADIMLTFREMKR